MKRRKKNKEWDCKREREKRRGNKRNEMRVMYEMKNKMQREKKSKKEKCLKMKRIWVKRGEKYGW